MIAAYTIMVYLYCRAERLKPTYDLASFLAWSRSAEFRTTGSAMRSAVALGFDAAAMVGSLQTMTRKHFRKSMTSYEDHRVWQDVYNVPSTVGELYVKFRADVVTEFLLLSFKEKDE